jgi:hypothetical protein
LTLFVGATNLDFAFNDFDSDAWEVDNFQLTF